MDKEMSSLREAKTFYIRLLPTSKRTVKGKWDFTLKYNESGEVSRYKARWVAKGFTQKNGIGFTETFAPVVNFKSVRTRTALCAVNNWPMYQDNFPTAFLTANLEEEVRMEQPIGLAILP